MPAPKSIMRLLRIMRTTVDEKRTKGEYFALKDDRRGWMLALPELAAYAHPMVRN